MPNQLQKTTTPAPRVLEQDVVQDSQSTLRRDLATQNGFDAQSRMVRPGGGGAAGVSGPIGRLFNRILGVDESRTNTTGAAFTRAQLRSYLDTHLELAKGEWFRDAKLDGVSDKLMEVLDKDRNGKVTWGEFQAFRTEILGAIAPGVEPGSAPEKVKAAATGSFGKVDGGATGNGDGKLSYLELQKSTQAQLPAGTEHADLVAQLGARIAIDAGDTDQRSKPVDKRELTRAEWIAAALELAR